MNPTQHAIFRACWLLLRDLQRIGWQLHWRSNTVFLGKPDMAATPNSPEEIVSQKRAIQDAMSFARLDRLNQYSDFIQRMLLPTSNGLAKHSMLALVADGAGIAQDLSKIVRARSTEKRLGLLQEAIRPYLQLVVENERCEFTGHRLADIWRFFRFSWSNPPETTPGRTLLYLVRDAARPFHPIMGIFSLENAALRISCRDHHLGWTPESFIDNLRNNGASTRALRSRFAFLIKSLDRGIDDIDIRRLCRQRDLAEPTEKVIRTLAEIARQSDDQRMTAVKDWHERPDDADEEEQSDLGNISLVAEEALYRRKRAEQLSRLLAAKLRLQQLLASDTFGADANRFIQTESGMASLRAALFANKNKHVGTSILELNVCGAIPPYNELLAGKLTALLAISPTVVADYRRRYGERPSDIASRMKGSSVVRPAELVFVGTSSLYAGGASQYNRLRLPKELFGSTADVVWQRLGITAGYGTLHISRETLNALENVLVVQGKASRSNHVFGEGASPKFRSVRSGIESVLLPRHRATADAIGRHEMRRIVYGCAIAENVCDVLSNVATRPRFYFGRQPDHRAATDRIITFWTDRWLGSRINYRPALEKVAAFDIHEWLAQSALDTHVVTTPSRKSLLKAT
ncbi:MAG: Druantia anti-phage system protein DruA [Pirellulales bacterium]